MRYWIWPTSLVQWTYLHDDVIKWKHFPRYWPFVRGIHRSPVNSPLKGQWRGALMFSLIRVWINYWVNNRQAGDLRRHRAHYHVIVMEGQATVDLMNKVTTIRGNQDSSPKFGCHVSCPYAEINAMTLSLQMFPLLYFYQIEPIF